MSNFKESFRFALQKSWQDRSTYVARVLFPLILLLSMILLASIAGFSSFGKKAKAPNVAVFGLEQDSLLAKKLTTSFTFKLIPVEKASALPKLIKSDSVLVGLEIEEGFTETLKTGKQGGLKLYYDSRKSEMTKQQVVTLLEGYEHNILTRRLDSLYLSEQYIDPISIVEENTYSWMNEVPKYLAAVLPFFIALFAFWACIYSSFDLFDKNEDAEELSGSQSLANWLMTIIMGLKTAFLTTLGLYAVVKYNPAIPVMFKNVFINLFALKTVGIYFLALIPLLLFFAVLLALIRLMAGSYKRAMNIVTPIKVFVFLTFALVFSPDLELADTALYWPGSNVTLFGREVFMYSWKAGQLLWVSLSLLVYSLVGMALVLKRGEEK